MTAFYALIPAAGASSRMAADLPKQYLPIAGRPVLRHVLDTFAASTVAHLFLVVAPGDHQAQTVVRSMLRADGSPADGNAITLIHGGGATRRDTVRNGLVAMRSRMADDDWVLVHDAARPGLTPALLEHLMASLRDDPVGGLLAVPIVDTVKRADADGRSSETVPRDGLWLAQTPQMFRYGLLCDALAQDASFTDEASAVEALGLRPKLVIGSADNFKITVAADLIAAEALFARRRANDPAHPLTSISANAREPT